MALRFAPRIGTRVGPLYVGTTIYSTNRPATTRKPQPVQPKRRTPAQHTTNAARAIAAHERVIAKLQAQEAAQRTARPVAQPLAWQMQPTQRPATQHTGYGPATLYRAQRATSRTPAPAGRYQVIALGMILATVVALVGMTFAAMAMHIIPATLGSVTPPVPSSISHSAPANTHPAHTVRKIVNQ